MKPYSKYKDSGLEWLGAAPEYRKIKRLKYVIAGLESRAGFLFRWSKNG